MTGAPRPIPAALRAQLRELRLVARTAAAAGGIGQHVSRNRGAGLEFAQYRGYEPGDEPRRIDWKLYARSDRWFVRESERDSPLCVWLAVDASASMAQADTARRDWNKLDAARLLAACVMELALRQGDRFGLVVLSAQKPVFVAAAGGARQHDRCRFELERVQAAGAWPDAALLQPMWERVQAGDLVLLLSDFFDEAAVELAGRLAVAGRDVLTIQLIGADERDFPFRGARRFRDPESGLEKRADAAAVREDFIARFAAARAALAAGFAAVGIRHAEHVLDEAPERVLRRLFAVQAAQREGA